MISRPHTVDTGVVDHKKQHRTLAGPGLGHQLPQVLLATSGYGIGEKALPVLAQGHIFHLHPGIRMMLVT